MGRRQGQVAKMGKSILIKEKQRRQGPRRDDSFLHTSDLQDGPNYNRINFQSVTEQSNLEDFLVTAELAGRDFTAERQNISIISNPGQGIILTPDDILKISEAQEQHKSLLQIPRRPDWDEFTSKEELQLRERDSFTSWRRQLKILEEQEHIELTPYEKNLDFWRQLWRVIEKSDVIVQIVDARNPLLFRCEDLETYTKEVNTLKTVMLLVNKADYLNHQQRTQWVDFFNQEGIQAVFFSAKTEIEKHEDTDPDALLKKLDINEDLYKESSDEEEDEEKENSDSLNTIEEDDDVSENCESDLKESSNSHLTSDSNLPVTSPNLGDKDTNNCSINCDNNDSTSSSATELSSPRRTPSNCQDDTNEPINKQASFKSCDTSESKNVLLLENKTDIVSADELLEIFKKLANPSTTARAGEVRTVGMVGYPNVGKSSTINVILKEKKLAVSATPGRTKHLQTLFVDENLMLCDCPGLVFPSFVATKAHLVINGILPIDELRDHVSPINLICEYIPRNVLEATYSIMIPQPSSDDDPNRPPTVEELLNAYGGMRGFMTQRGIPDGPRASRYLLKDFVKGKLLYCDPPPGIPGSDFQDKERITKLEAERPIVKAPLPQIQSAVDKEFFQKRQSNINSKGVKGVKGFVRVDCTRPTARRVEGQDDISVAGSVAGSMTSLNSCGVGVTKPWKKHKNQKKREKLRRVHRDLDVV